MLSLALKIITAKHAIGRVLGDRKGVTAIEYGLIAGAIAVAIIASVLALGSDITGLFSRTASAIGTVAPAAAPPAAK
jgi:pilus assembly protein Flp/PilA